MFFYCKSKSPIIGYVFLGLENNTVKMSDRKAVIKNADMSEEMQQVERF